MKKFRSQVMTWTTAGQNNPPDVYRITYNLRSIIGFINGQPQYYTGFTVEIRFPPDYPRSKPDIQLVSTPHPFHPNIWVQGRFCIEGGQHWIPGIGVPLDSLCQMLGEVIAYQTYNLRSPANADQIMAQWIKTNATRLPVDPTPIRLPDSEDAIHWGDAKPAPKASPRIRFS
jgi:ubiquitin-protein ligase